MNRHGTTSTVSEWMNCIAGYYSNSIQKRVTRFEDNCDSSSTHTWCIKKGWINSAHQRSSITVISSKIQKASDENVQTSKEVHAWFKTIRWKLVTPIKSKTILVRVWFIWTLSGDTAPQNPFTWGMNDKTTIRHCQSQAYSTSSSKSASMRF